MSEDPTPYKATPPADAPSMPQPDDTVERAWLILFYDLQGTQSGKWESFVGTEKQAEQHATFDDRHLNYGRNGYRLIPMHPDPGEVCKPCTSKPGLAGAEWLALRNVLDPVMVQTKHIRAINVEEVRCDPEGKGDLSRFAVTLRVHSGEHVIPYCVEYVRLPKSVLDQVSLPDRDLKRVVGEHLARKLGAVSLADILESE